MNRNFLVALAAIIAVFAISISGLTLFLGSTRLLSASEKVVRRSFESQSKVFTTFVREDLLIDNTLAARKKLEKLCANGSISGYSIFKNGEKIESSTVSNDAVVSVENPVFFTNSNTTEWGRIRYDFSVSETEKERYYLQCSIWLSLVVQTLCLLFLFLFSFGYLYKATGRISNLLSEYILDFKLKRQGSTIEFVWSPVLTVLRQSSAKYRELREESIKLEKEAAVGRITTQLSHDMRAPLGTFEKILLSDDEEKSLAFKPAVKESLNRLYSMIESLRYPESEVLIKREKSLLSINHGIESLASKAKQRGIVILTSTIENLWLDVDQAKFERAWVNIVSNAIDFACAVVRIEVESEDSELTLRIIDDGHGVPEDFLPKLFQRGSTRGKADGTGLGLAYARQIMRGHGGDVTYRREKGLTIFECALPSAVEPEKDKLVEESATLEIQIQQKIIKAVAICLEPRDLSERVLEKLTSLKSDEFVFIYEREKANIVVSNIESIMFEVMESDEQEHISVATFKDDEVWMTDVLKMKFNLA